MPIGLLNGGLSAEGGLVATTLLTMGDAAAFFSMTCPSYFTVRSPFFSEQGAHRGNVKTMRAGMAAATAFSLAVGWGASTLIGSWLPLWGAAAVVTAEIAGFEWCMAHPVTEGGGAGGHPTLLDLILKPSR